MIKFRKGDDLKVVDWNSPLVSKLKASGWTEEGAEPSKPSEADIHAIRTQLDEAGIKYHHKAGYDKLKELLPK